LQSGKQQRRFSDVIHAGMEHVSDLLFLGRQHLSKNLIGLEINTDYIKCLQLSGKDNQLEVDYFAVAPLPVGAVVKDEVKDFNAVTNSLKSLFRASKLSSANIAIAIPRSSAIIKDITVDKRLNIDEIESRVWIEANRFFPNLIGEIYLDFAVIGPSAQDASQLEIILVACRKEQIDPYLDVIRQADLYPRLVDINSYALERTLTLIAKQYPDTQTLALLNISFSLITLIVIHEGILIYTHELNYDGHNLSHLNENSTGGNDLKIESLTALKGSLSLHLRHTMQFFYSSRPNIRIEQLILSGDCAVIFSDLPDFIMKETGKTVMLANPFKNLKIAKGLDESNLQKYAPSLMLCCGLAMSKPTN